MTSWARVGQKVVCVALGREPNADVVTYPQVGEIYTIRETDQHGLGGVGLRFEEIVNPVFLYVGGRVHEAIFMAKRFRPLVTKTQADDVALFAPLLAGRVGTKQGVDA